MSSFPYIIFLIFAPWTRFLVIAPHKSAYTVTKLILRQNVVKHYKTAYIVNLSRVAKVDHQKFPCRAKSLHMKKFAPRTMSAASATNLMCAHFHPNVNLWSHMLDRKYFKWSSWSFFCVLKVHSYSFGVCQEVLFSFHASHYVGGVLAKLQYSPVTGRGGQLS